MVTVSSIGSGKKVNVGQNFANGMSALQTNEKEKFVVVDDSGTQKDAERVSLFKFSDTSKKYIVYTFNEVDDNEMLKLYVAILNHSDKGYSIENIVDADEWTKAKNAMRKIAKDGQQIIKDNNDDHKTKVKNGENIELEDGISVLNDESIVEPEVKEESATVEVPAAPVETEEAPTEIPVETPSIPQEESVIAPPEPVPVAPIELNIPNVDLNQPSMTPEFDTNVNQFGGMPDMNGQFGMDNSFASSNLNDMQNYNNDFGFNNSISNGFDNNYASTDTTNDYAQNDGMLNSNSTIPKSKEDVEISIKQLASEVEDLVNNRIKMPMMTLTEVTRRFILWGEDVVNHGLNRKSFEEFDELKDLYNGIEEFKYNDNQSNDSSNEDNDNIYGFQNNIN